MTDKKLSPSTALLGAALLGALAMFGSAAAGAQQHVEEARVISSTPIRTPDGLTSYSVTYEYAGRQYTTRTDAPPGDYIQLQLSPMGVMAAQPAQPYQDEAPPANYGNAEPWRNVNPEPGVVLSGNSGGAVAPAPVYAAPPVVYPAPAPVYAPPAYGYYGGPVYYGGPAYYGGAGSAYGGYNNPNRYYRGW